MESSLSPGRTLLKVRGNQRVDRRLLWYKASVAFCFRNIWDSFVLVIASVMGVIISLFKFFI